jgi:hypothetical protein
MPRLLKLANIMQADTSDLTRLKPEQIVKLLPFEGRDAEIWPNALTMYAEIYGEQAFEMRANEINPGTFKQWLIRQVGRRRWSAARKA